MTIKELKEAIKDLPDNMEVFMYERQTEFAYGLVNSATVKEIKFTEDAFPDYDNDDLTATEKVLVISEE